MTNFHVYSRLGVMAYHGYIKKYGILTHFALYLGPSCLNLNNHMRFLFCLIINGKTFLLFIQSDCSAMRPEQDLGQMKKFFYKFWRYFYGTIPETHLLTLHN